MPLLRSCITIGCKTRETKRSSENSETTEQNDSKYGFEEPTISYPDDGKLTTMKNNCSAYDGCLVF